MTHPHKAMLDEFKYALDHLPPTVPAEIIEEGRKLHKELLDNPEATQEQIHSAFVLIGKKEFPYRRAYEEMVESGLEKRRLELILEHLEPNVREKVQKYLDDGISLEALVKSSMFEIDFTAEERYQLEDGILHAADHIKEEVPDVIKEHRADYDKLVETWRKKQGKMEEKINELRALANKDPKWRDEILDKVKTLEEGWSVAERDPELLEIEKEIEYWIGTMGEES